MKVVGKFGRATASRKCFVYKHIGNKLNMFGKFYRTPPSRTCFLYKHSGAYFKYLVC